MTIGRAFWTPKLLRGLAGIVACFVLWEAFARSGMFSASLTPSLGTIVERLLAMARNGTLLINTSYTMGRMVLGMAIAFVLAIPIGFAMGRSYFAERFFQPLVSVFLPIPSLAWVPLFTLWFGIGETATICVVVYAAFFPLLYNVWIGVRSVNPLWIRVAEVMGADRKAMFLKIIWPGSLQYILTGLRLALGRAWIGVVGGELLASPVYGLGQVIFNAKEFLNAGVMLAVLVLIGTIGMIFERFVFFNLEEATVRKWGMSHDNGS